MKRIVNRKRFNFVSNLIETIFYVIIIGAGIAILYYGSMHTTEPAYKMEKYTVQTGDTLWQIASQNKPKEISVQEYIYKVQNYNKIDCDLFPGQVIMILKEE